MNKNKKKLLIIGAFDFKNKDSGGQLVKTRELYYLFKETNYFSKVKYLDTCNWKRLFFFKVFELLFKIIRSNYIIMLPASNGLKFFSKLLPFFKRNRFLFYSVIGGWLSEVIKNNQTIKKNLMKFDGIFVETSSMERALNQQGFTNVAVVPNFKKIDPIVLPVEKQLAKLPLKVCTFSRVVKEKGIEDAIDAVISINTKYGSIIYELDIYGQIDELYKNDFLNIMSKSPSYIKYMGLVDTKKSNTVLSSYFALLFPTKYFTEGIPGTFIDAYYSGLPVITTLWMNHSDVFEENITGYGYPFGDANGLKECMIKAYNNKDYFVKMRNNCIEKSRMFTIDYALDLYVSFFEKTIDRKAKNGCVK